MSSPDAFDLNIAGAMSIVSDDTNKVKDSPDIEEGVDGDYEDNLELPMSDEELLTLKREWESKSDGYYPKVKARQQRNKTYLKGKQRNFSAQEDRVVSKNLLFEATATFVPAALAENPEPVVFSDNTDEGKAASNDLKTMLQFHAKTLGLRQKLGVLVWQWSEYFIGAVKHGWEPNIDEETGEDTGDITTELRKPQNLVLDPDGYVDEFGDFHGWIGDRIEKKASWFIEKFPKHATYITLKVNGKLGTRIVATEWWEDMYCFTTFGDIVLDKHKNEFYNYGEGASNHFAKPKKPYTFLSVFSLQEEPYDFTNLIEQNIPNQDRVNDRDDQISKNLASAQNGILLSGQSFNVENQEQAVQSFYEEGMVVIPDGNMDAIKRVPANPLPDGIMESQASDMDSLRGIYGTKGLVPNQNPEEAVRNNIMNEQHDSSRIGGGVGDRLEIVSENIFNWWVQLYCKFYDTAHYGAVMGNAAAIEYVSLTKDDMERKFVVTVSPNSMAPKDEVSERNEAIQLADGGWLDPINLFKALDDADPVNTAKMVTMFRTNPQLYMQTFFPESQPMGAPAGAPAPEGGIPSPIQPQQGSPPGTLAAPQAPSALSAVPISPLPK